MCIRDSPAGILGIEAARKVFGNIPMVAVFDTAFHSTMPPKAYMYALSLIHLWMIARLFSKSCCQRRVDFIAVPPLSLIHICSKALVMRCFLFWRALVKAVPFTAQLSASEPQPVRCV